MSSNAPDRSSPVREQELQWVVCMGDFALLRKLQARKRQSYFWMFFSWIDALLRGFGQVVFANNPISGILIIIAFGLTVPGTLVAGAGTGFLGLLLSLILGDTDDNVYNGLTVYNPVLIGFVTYTLAPNSDGRFDIFTFFIIIVGTIFSVYLTRSLATGRFPCITVPFNVVEVILLLSLSVHRDFLHENSDVPRNVTEGYGNNATTPSSINDTTNETFFDEKLNWGMVFRGIVVSSSQVYAVDDVAAAAVIYLGILVYSPTTAFFSVLGASMGCFVALLLNVPYAPIYAGLWGYNALLTGAAFGGLFFVINGQTGAAASLAMIFATMFQYVAEPLMAKIGLPVLTIPFVVTAWLFFGLRDSVDGTFPRPASITFPENELHDLHSRISDSNVYIVADNSDHEVSSSVDQKPSVA